MSRIFIATMPMLAQANNKFNNIEPMERTSSHNIELERGKELRSYLYKLVQEGDYEWDDSDIFAISERFDQIDPDEPYLETISADYQLEDDTVIYLVCAAKDEDSEFTGAMSRNQISFLTPMPETSDKDDTPVLARRLNLYLDEVTGKIGYVERKVVFLGKYHHKQNKESVEIALGTDIAPSVSLESVIMLSARNKASGANLPLSNEEYAEAMAKLAALKPEHRISSYKL